MAENSKKRSLNNAEASFSVWQSLKSIIRDSSSGDPDSGQLESLEVTVPVPF